MLTYYCFRFVQIWYLHSPRRKGLPFRLQMFKIGQKVNLKNFGVFEQIYCFGNIWMDLQMLNDTQIPYHKQMG